MDQNEVQYSISERRLWQFGRNQRCVGGEGI